MDKVTFAKLPANSGWGVKGSAKLLKLGARVEVTLRDGTTEMVTVKACVWTRGDIALMAVERDPWERR